MMPVVSGTSVSGVQGLGHVSLWGKTDRQRHGKDVNVQM